jgi:hypothetical protein
MAILQFPVCIDAGRRHNAELVTKLGCLASGTIVQEPNSSGLKFT